MDSLGERAERAIGRLATALELGDRTRDIMDALRGLAGDWPDRSAASPYPSFATPDGSPLELSFPVHAPTPELRLGIEPQASAPSFEKNWEVAVAMLSNAERYGADTAQLRALLPLVEPLAGFHPPFGLWFGVAFRGSSSPLVRAYISLDAAVERGHSVTDVLARLGGGRACDAALEALGTDGKVGMLGIDLVPSAAPQLKLYLVHAPVPAIAYQSIERVGALATGYVAGDASQLLDAILPLKEGEHQPVFLTTTLHIAGDDIGRSTFSLQVLSGKAVGLTSVDITAKISAYLTAREGSAATLQRAAVAVGADAPGRYDDYTFVGVQREDGRPRTVVYLTPKLYAPR